MSIQIGMSISAPFQLELLVTVVIFRNLFCIIVFCAYHSGEKAIGCQAGTSKKITIVTLKSSAQRTRGQMSIN